MDGLGRLCRGDASPRDHHRRVSERITAVEEFRTTTPSVRRRSGQVRVVSRPNRSRPAVLAVSTVRVGHHCSMWNGPAPPQVGSVVTEETSKQGSSDDHEEDGRKRRPTQDPLYHGADPPSRDGTGRISKHPVSHPVVRSITVLFEVVNENVRTPPGECRGATRHVRRYDHVLHIPQW